LILPVFWPEFVRKRQGLLCLGLAIAIVWLMQFL
jgi:hypothetical protein